MVRDMVVVLPPRSRVDSSRISTRPLLPLVNQVPTRMSSDSPRTSTCGDFVGHVGKNKEILFTNPGGFPHTSTCPIDKVISRSMHI